MSVICLLCDKMFATQSTLNRHKRETHHLGINASAYEFDKYNAKCYECASSFLFVSTLREHLDKLHNFKSETIYLNFNNMQGE